MKSKIILLIMCLILLTGLVNSGKESLGTFEQGEDIELLQICADCTFNNITSVTYPDSTIAIQDKLMTKIGTEFNHTLNSTYTNELGTYLVNGIGDIEGTNEIWVYTFEVTPNGEALSSSKMFIQIALVTFLLLLFIFSLIGVFKVENYIGRFALYWVSHVLFISISFIAWQMATDFLTGTPMIASMFKIIFYFFMIGAFPMLILSLAWIFKIHLINDDIKRMMERGMPEAEAYDRARSKRKW